MTVRALEQLRNFLTEVRPEPPNGNRIQLDFLGRDGVEDKTPSYRLISALQSRLYCNAVDRDTYRLITQFMAKLDNIIFAPATELEDFLFGIKEIGKLPPGEPCTTQPYQGLRFDLEGRVFLFIDLEHY